MSYMNCRFRLTSSNILFCCITAYLYAEQVSICLPKITSVIVASLNKSVITREEISYEVIQHDVI